MVLDNIGKFAVLICEVVVYNVPVVVPPDLASTFSINCKKDLTGIDSIRSEWGKKDMCIAALSEDVTGRLNKKKKR